MNSEGEILISLFSKIKLNILKETSNSDFCSEGRMLKCNEYQRFLVYILFTHYESIKLGLLSNAGQGQAEATMITVLLYRRAWNLTR